MKKHEMRTDRIDSCKNQDEDGLQGRRPLRLERLDDILIRERRHPPRTPEFYGNFRKERVIFAVISIPFCLASFLMHGAFTGIVVTLVFGVIVWLLRFNPFIPGRISNMKLRVVILMIGFAAIAIRLIVSLIGQLHR